MPMRRRSSDRPPAERSVTFSPNTKIKPPRRPERHEEQPQKRGLAGARGPGQEVKGPRKHVKGDVAQDFRATAVAQPDIVKADHPCSLSLLTLRHDWRLYAELPGPVSMDLGKGMGPGANPGKRPLWFFRWQHSLSVRPATRAYETAAVIPPRGARCAARNAAHVWQALAVIEPAKPTVITRRYRPRRASTGADGAASCSRGTASRRGAASSTLRAASGLDGFGHAHGPLSWRTLCASRSRSWLRRQAEQRSDAEWRTGAGTSGEDW